MYAPTGPYHRLVENTLTGKLPPVKMNPLQARRFAKSCETCATTSALDARDLTCMETALASEPDAVISQNARVL
jgi:transposase